MNIDDCSSLFTTICHCSSLFALVFQTLPCEQSLFGSRKIEETLLAGYPDTRSWLNHSCFLILQAGCKNGKGTKGELTKNPGSDSSSGRGQPETTRHQRTYSPRRMHPRKPTAQRAYSLILQQNGQIMIMIIKLIASIWFNSLPGLLSESFEVDQSDNFGTCFTTCQPKSWMSTIYKPSYNLKQTI